MLCVCVCVRPAVMFSRAMLYVCIRWLIFVRCSMGPLLTRKDQIISGDLLKDASRIPDLEW